MTADRADGVLTREQHRQQAWTLRGLPDPVGVLAEERAMRGGVGSTSWKHPARAELDAFFAANPDVQPPGGW